MKVRISRTETPLSRAQCHKFVIYPRQCTFEASNPLIYWVTKNTRTQQPLNRFWISCRMYPEQLSNHSQPLSPMFWRQRVRKLGSMGHSSLKITLAVKILPVRIFQPAINQLLIGRLMNVFQIEQSHRQSGGFPRQFLSAWYRLPNWLSNTVQAIGDNSRTLDGFLYLAVIQDACSRRIVGWAMQKNQQASLMVKALKMAL